MRGDPVRTVRTVDRNVNDGLDVMDNASRWATVLALALAVLLCGHLLSGC